jgi:RNA-directed DNA polymerase
MGTIEPQEKTRTKLTEIAWSSAHNPQKVYHSLMHLYNVESLRGCFEQLDGKKAVGIDSVTKMEYGEKLQENLENLINRMKRMAYRPAPVKLVLIPKEGKPNATRPLGISNFEDKLVQKKTQEILESIYDPIFLPCSYGFRPGRGCHDAIQDLYNYLYKEEVEIVIDVDLANFFGTIDHKILGDMLGIKIKDPKFLRYINRSFKAGVLTQGELSISDEGVSQGSICSPILSNVFAHYVIDTWLEETVKPLMAGKIRIFRYADDLIICCQYFKDAIRIKNALSKRLSKYNLKLNEDKTKMVEFSKIKESKDVKQETFDFLGFTFYLGRSRKGYTIPQVKTSGKRYRSKLKRVNEWARQIRNKYPLQEIWKIFCSKLRGHIQYYGVSFNMRSIGKFSEEAKRIMFKWLNRRSQKKSFNWDKFGLYIKKFPMPAVKIYHKLF